MTRSTIAAIPAHSMQLTAALRTAASGVPSSGKELSTASGSPMEAKAARIGIS